MHSALLIIILLIVARFDHLDPYNHLLRFDEHTLCSG